MGQLGVVEGGVVIGGEYSGGAFSFEQNNLSVCAKTSEVSYLHSGDYALLMSDFPLNGYQSWPDHPMDFNNDYPNEPFNAMGGNTFITTGKGADIRSFVSDDERFFGLGDENTVDIGLGTEIILFDESKGRKDSTAEYEFGVTAVIDGARSQIRNNLIDDSRVKVKDSILVSLGEENGIQTVGKNCGLVSLGERSNIQLNDSYRKEFPESVKYLFSAGMNSHIYGYEQEQSLPSIPIFVAQKAGEINTNSEVTLFAEQSPESFRVGKNSVVAIGWHDGFRQRIAVFYEGEDIEADKYYRVNENGQAVEVN
ncbi:hypothetical protein GY03_01005 [Proteus vulgaris]|uniref:hypothetical protein n=1 Tax=Proteus vulgaris TaxID=585 RepID=UPI0021B0F294|nr:hypothetical protein [Proteus vulgaris]MCT6515867.1 hypothetical protein [Proteus vulgaris]